MIDAFNGIRSISYPCISIIVAFIYLRPYFFIWINLFFTSQFLNVLVVSHNAFVQEIHILLQDFPHFMNEFLVYMHRSCEIIIATILIRSLFSFSSVILVSSNRLKLLSVISSSISLRFHCWFLRSFVRVHNSFSCINCEFSSFIWIWFYRWWIVVDFEIWMRQNAKRKNIRSFILRAKKSIFR